MDVQSLATVKARLSQYLDVVEGTHERVLITRNGRPVAVLISVDELESIEETLDLLSDPQAMAEIRQAQEDLRQGGGIPLEDVVDDFENRRRSGT